MTVECIHKIMYAGNLKRSIACMLLLAFLIGAQAIAAPPPGVPAPPDAADCSSCGATLSPVCTSGGLTIANACLAKCQGLLDFIDGACNGKSDAHYIQL